MSTAEALFAAAASARPALPENGAPWCVDVVGVGAWLVTRDAEDGRACVARASSAAAAPANACVVRFASDDVLASVLAGERTAMAAAARGEFRVVSGGVARAKALHSLFAAASAMRQQPPPPPPAGGAARPSTARSTTIVGI